MLYEFPAALVIQITVIRKTSVLFAHITTSEFVDLE